MDTNETLAVNRKSRALRAQLARAHRARFLAAFPFYPVVLIFALTVPCVPCVSHCGISFWDGRVIHAWDTVRIDDYLAIEKFTALTGDHPKYLVWVALERVLDQKTISGACQGIKNSYI